MSDEEIAKLVQCGQTEEFGSLVQRYEPKILRYGKRFLSTYEDIEDAVQETFIKAYTNIQSFDTKQNFSPWIYRIAHNTFVNVIRSKGREPVTVFDPDTIFGNLVATEETDTSLIESEISKEMEYYMQQLPPKYREPIILFFYEEKNYKEISDIMHIPTSTVGVRIRRGKERLKNIYNEHKK